MLKSLRDILDEHASIAQDSYVEPALNLPVFCTGLANARVKDGALHLAFFIELDGPNGVEHVLNLRIAMQATAWHGMRQKTDEAIAAFKRSFHS